MPSVDVTVVTYPGAESGPVCNLREEIDLVRSVVLYADSVEIISMKAAMVGSYVNLAADGEDGLLSLLSSLDPDTISYLTGGAGLPDGWQEAVPLFRAAGKVPGLLESLGAPDGSAQLDAALAQGEREVQLVAGNLIDESGLHEFERALREGIVSISSGDLTPDGGPDAWAESWVEHLSKLVTDGDRRVLVDDRVAQLIGSLTRGGRLALSEVVLTPAREAVVGSGLIARLPAFPQAPLDELLDLRADLGDPLVRYRSAVGRLSQTLTNPFGSDVASMIDDIWIRDVDPALLELRELLGDHSLVREVARSVGLDMKTAVATGTGAAIYIGFDRLAAVQGAIAAAVAASSVVSQFAIGPIQQRAAARREASRHELYFLHQVDRRLHQ